MKGTINNTKNKILKIISIKNSLIFYTHIFRSYKGTIIKIKLFTNYKTNTIVTKEKLQILKTGVL